MRGLIISILSVLLTPPAFADEQAEGLTAKDIVSRAYVEAGGDAWLKAKTMHLKGIADFYRGGVYGPGTRADGYEMWRVYPDEGGAAHMANGKFRLDSSIQGKIMFQTAFDGMRSYTQDGLVPEEKQQTTQQNSGFGFGAFRKALLESYTVTRLTDQKIEAHPVYMLKVTDPNGQDTLFGVDIDDFSIRSVHFDTPSGWHKRIYSDFMWSDNPRFRQAGRVRHYYDGVMTVDIDWQQFWVNEEFSENHFAIEEQAE